MKKYTADFETCVWLEDETFVWAWAVCEIGNPDNIIIGNNIDTFFEFVESQKNAQFYFHNLKFDGEFILNYLLKQNFKFVDDKKKYKIDKQSNIDTICIVRLGAQESEDHLLADR